jgi:putative heme-binding domain-containing protein
VPTPQGDLLVTCHSGHPDWGTGPQGKGKLFKISYADRTAPQPVLAYAASPTETRITFDRPVDAVQFKNLAKQSSVTMGRYVAAGDRFESFRPGYQAVKDQTTVARFGVSILSAAVSGDARTLVLQTPRRTEAVNYAVTLPCSARLGIPQADSKAANEIDLLTDLTGVEASWSISGRETKWTGWLPHLDLEAAHGLTAASTEHARLFELAAHRGTLTLQAQLDTALMLHPKTQPGAKLDYVYPPETVTFVFKASGKLEIKAGSQAQVKRINAREWRITTESNPDQWLPIEVKLATGAGEPKLDVSWFTAEDSRQRALPLRRILLPWATPHAEPATSEPRQIPEIAGGDWQRGKKVFFGEQVACFKCHQVGGEGGKIGPDLSNLIYRDYVSVLRDITEPSAALNPDHIAYQLELKDGNSVTGVIVGDTAETTLLGQATGGTVAVEKSKIANMKASTVSLMPEGLLRGLPAQQQKDLLTFLLTEAPQDKKH